LAAELSPEELKKLSKEERTAYYAARRNALPKAPAKKQQLTKKERAMQQEEQRKAIQDKKAATLDNEEMFKELKLQGMSEDQARELMNEMLKRPDEAGNAEEEDKQQAADEAGDAEEEDQDLLSSVKSWMAAQDQELPADALSDFNLKVRFQGHVDTTPPDHMTAILHIITELGCAQCELDAKTQPATVANKLEPDMTRWAAMLKPLFKKIGDELEGLDAVMRGIQEGVEALVSVPESGKACGVVGCLMALRAIDMIEDEDLLTACRRAEPRSKVMEKFIEFLEAELEDEDDDEEDED